MTEDTTAGSTGEPRDEPTDDRERTPNTLLNGLIGGIVAVVFGFVPFSTVLGGGVAGYLEGGSYDDGAKAGLIAGTIAFLPIAAAIAVLLLFVPVASGPGAGPQVAIWAVVLLVLLVSAVYAVGLGVLGGVVGVYLKEEL